MTDSNVCKKNALDDVIVKHFEHRIDGACMQLNLRIDGVIEAAKIVHDTSMNLEKLHAAAHANEHLLNDRADALRQINVDKTADMISRAVDKSEAMILAKFHETNEWRAQYTSQMATFPTRDYVDTRMDVIVHGLDTLESAVISKELFDTKIDAIHKEAQEARDFRITAQAQQRTWALVISFIVIAVNLALKYL